MAHLIHSINSTLDGGCYHEDVVPDEEHHAYAICLVQSASALLLGSNTFALFQEFWPSATHRSDLPPYVKRLAKALTETQKLVVSSRPLSVQWHNTTQLDGPSLGKTRQALKALNGNVVLLGSPGLAASLSNELLIQEVHILLQPMFSSRGPQLPTLWRNGRLHAVSAKQFASGVTFLRYAAEASYLPPASSTTGKNADVEQAGRDDADEA